MLCGRNCAYFTLFVFVWSNYWLVILLKLGSFYFAYIMCKVRVPEKIVWYLNELLEINVDLSIRLKLGLSEALSSLDSVKNL